jgi:hypothetical protein
MEASQTRRGINAIRRGENVGLTASSLAMAITTMIIVFTGSHCYDLATVALLEGLECGVRGSRSLEVGCCDWQRMGFLRMRLMFRGVCRGVVVQEISGEGRVSLLASKGSVEVEIKAPLASRVSVPPIE